MAPPSPGGGAPGGEREAPSAPSTPVGGKGEAEVPSSPLSWANALQCGEAEAEGGDEGEERIIDVDAVRQEPFIVDVEVGRDLRVEEELDAPVSVPLRLALGDAAQLAGAVSQQAELPRRAGAMAHAQWGR